MLLYIQKKCKNVKERGVLFLSKHKNRQDVKPVVEKQENALVETIEEVKSTKETSKKVKTKKNKEENVEKMDENKLKQAEELVNALSGVDPNQIKRIKNDRGLIERTESSKVVLTEDNRQILND